MLYDIIFYSFITVSFINIVHIGSYLIGANIYDVMDASRLAKLPKRRNRNPLVTVIIPAHNESISVLSCIKSVVANSYKKIQVLVVDDASTDDTRRLVREYIQNNPKKPVQLLYRHNNHGKASALNHALRRRATGDLCMTLDGDSILHKDAIKNAVSYFDDPKVVGVAANVVVAHGGGVLGVLQRFEHMVGYRSKKFYSLSNSEYIVGGVASTYRMSSLKRVRFYDEDTLTEDIGLSLKVTSLGNVHNRLVYASDVVAMTEGVHSLKALFRQRYRWKMGGLQNIYKYRYLVGETRPVFSKMLTFYRLPMAFVGEIMLLIEPVLMLYILYFSVLAGNPAIFIGAYSMITLYLFIIILPRERINTDSKRELAKYIPILYFIFFVMNIVQLTSVVRCLLNYRQITGMVATSSKWVSPERVGYAAKS